MLSHSQHQSGIIALGAAGSEDHFLNIASQHPGNLPPGQAHFPPGVSCRGIQGGRVLPAFCHAAAHGGDDGRVRRRGGGVVQIDGQGKGGHGVSRSFAGVLP